MATESLLGLERLRMWRVRWRVEGGRMAEAGIGGWECGGDCNCDDCNGKGGVHCEGEKGEALTSALKMERLDWSCVREEGVMSGMQRKCVGRGRGGRLGGMILRGVLRKGW